MSGSSELPASSSSSDDRGRRRLPEWPGRLIELGGRLRAERPSEEPRLRGELWTLLLHVLRTKLRAESRRLGALSPEDLADLAADRALELVGRIDQGRWDLAGSRPAAVASFLGTVARNAMIDRLRGRTRRRELPLEEADRAGLEAPGLPLPEAPDAAAHRNEFVEALIRCLAGLRPRHRRIWFWRVLVEMPSRVVAGQPEIGLRPGHVDVIQQRVRALVRACMGARGFQPFEVPSGTLGELWRRFPWLDLGGGRG